MIFGASVLGDCFSDKGNFRYVPTIDINYILFGSGNTGVTIDKIWGRNGYDLTKEKFDAISLYNPSWTDDTYMLADFNADVLNAGQIQPPGTCVFDSYTVHKVYTLNGNVVDEVIASEISGDSSSYRDYKNSYNCYYYITVNGHNLTSDGTYWCAPTSYSNLLTKIPWGYYLIDIKNSNSYFFNCNVEAGTETFNNEYTQYQINQSYDTFGKGKSNYSSGAFSGILFSENMFQADNSNQQSMLTSFKEFYNSKRPCIMKDRKGNVYNVLLTDYSESQLQIYLPTQVLVSAISWREVK